MLERIKKRLIHFDTDGVSIVSDFVAARQTRVRILRRAVHVCFYIQCAAALACVIIGIACGSGTAVLCVGTVLTAAAALAAVAGNVIIGAVNVGMSLAFAVVCFAVPAVPSACGVIMLCAAAAAALGFGAGYFRGYLLSFPASKIDREDYTLNGSAPAAPIPAEEPAEHIPQAMPEPQPEPRRSELMTIAQQVAKIMNNTPDSSGEEDTP